MTVGVGPWVCTLPCSSAQLSPSCPIWSVSPGPAPISCSLGLCSVHCLCALPACTLPGCAARVQCLGAACAHGLGAAYARGLWALPVHAAWALCLSAEPGRCLCRLPERYAWARGLGSASARSTRSWHCAHDHPPMCAGIECPMPQISFCSLHCPQCL